MTHYSLGTSSIWDMSKRKVPQIFQKYIDHSKIPGTRRVTWSKFYAEEPQLLGATLQNLFDRANWRPVFLHPCLIKVCETKMAMWGGKKNYQTLRCSEYLEPNTNCPGRYFSVFPTPPQGKAGGRPSNQITAPSFNVLENLLTFILPRWVFKC
jgi:hypothetical protein